MILTAEQWAEADSLAENFNNTISPLYPNSNIARLARAYRALRKEIDDLKAQIAGASLECSRCRKNKPCLLIPLDTGAHEPLCADCVSAMLGEAHELMEAARKRIADLEKQG